MYELVDYWKKQTVTRSLEKDKHDTEMVIDGVNCIVIDLPRLETTIAIDKTDIVMRELVLSYQKYALRKEKYTRPIKKIKRYN